MKKEEPIIMLGDIDVKFLDEYYVQRDKRDKKRNIIRKVSGMAASFLAIVILSGVLVMSPLFRNTSTDNPLDTGNDGRDTSYGEDTGSHTDTSHGTDILDQNNDPENNMGNNVSRDEHVVLEQPELSYALPYASDYAIPTDWASMMEAVDIVVEGTYEGDVSTYVTDIGQIITIGKISDLKFVKGGVTDSKSLNISFYGGVLTVSEFRKQAADHLSAKYGFDKMTEEEAETKYIGVPTHERIAGPCEGLRYMIFLSYNKPTGEYFVVCDGYGMRQMNSEGKVWNIDKSEFEEIKYKEGVN